VGQRRVASVAPGVVAAGEHGRRNAALLGALERSCAGEARCDRHDLGLVPVPDTSTAIGSGGGTRRTIAVSNLTEDPRGGALNLLARRESGVTPPTEGHQMLTATLITLLIVATLGYALRSSRGGGALLRRPYNNRYNDASGAREDSLG